jgi:hypothetical protein
MDISDFYFYLIYLIILSILSTIVRDRRLFQSNYSSLLLMSALLTFFGGYLFIRSLWGGKQYGSEVCGSEGCIFNQPPIFEL